MKTNSVSAPGAPAEQATKLGNVGDQIEFWSIEQLIPYARNPRRNDQAVERMAASIREFGFKIPVLARSNGEVIDGHLRLKAARKLGQNEIPVIRCDEWSPAQVKAFRLMVNRSVNWAEWDEQLLTLELAELQDLNFDLALTGFDLPELDDLLFRPSAEEEIEITPEAPEQPVSRLGDLWLLGGHRVLCGDATCRDAVKRLLASDTPGLMVTDPPYGVAYDPGWREQAGLGEPRQSGLVANDDRVDWAEAYLLFPGAVAYVWHAGVYTVETAQSLRSAGFQIRSQIMWVKQHFVLSRGNYHWQHEPCWYAVRKGGSAHWCGDRTQSTVWEAANLNAFGGGAEEATGHGTQKPLELMKRPVLNHTIPGEAVYDPFLGSGTTLIACEQSGRRCVGLEIDPRYVDAVISRWQSLSKKEAILEGTGQSFEEVGKQRVRTDGVDRSADPFVPAQEEQ